MGMCSCSVVEAHVLDLDRKIERQRQNYFVHPGVLVRLYFVSKAGLPLPYLFQNAGITGVWTPSVVSTVYETHNFMHARQAL